MVKEMKVIGFNIEKIHVEKSSDFKGKLELNSDMKIKDMQKRKMELMKQEILEVNFSFEINYGELGKVLIEGRLILALDSKAMKEAVNKWKEKNLPDDIKLPILNIILQKCALKALQLEEDIGLPPHMQLPRLQQKQSG